MAKGDIFIKIDSQRGGAIAGESNDAKHPGEIDVVGWSWGMQQSSAMGAMGAATGRRTLDAMTILKQVDSASTALMSCLSINDTIKKAVLTVRKASGATPVDYLKVTLEKGRISSIKLETDPDDAQKVLERIVISYQKIEIEYAAQSEKGASQARSTFTDSIERD
ncbi:MAG: type secretion system secreted protein Hcp [Pseudomonadota bacterium]|jgi:type VI secretion system secreted protein Hcp